MHRFWYSRHIFGRHAPLSYQGEQRQKMKDYMLTEENIRKMQGKEKETKDKQ
ncbi:hypothetical protein [Arenibacter algicola]|uniref:hypothetical protein n=1 Tax=Arenibacter algicola TaxID=616991 RepID=UPI000B324FA1|nr:hypothetical protein [Arenibacter algicola]